MIRSRLAAIALSASLLAAGCRAPQESSSLEPGPPDSVPGTDPASPEPAANCPQPPADYLPTVTPDPERFYEQFDFRIRASEIADRFARFSTPNHDLIWCAETWTVHPSTWTDPASDREELLANRIDPPSETIDLDGTSYQYRVLLDPNPFPDFQVDAERVVFELQAPDFEIRIPLYTRDEVDARGLGLSLGLPRIAAVATATIDSSERLTWAIAFEQGEGNGGIATLVEFNPASRELEVLQPEAIADQQVTDLEILGDPDAPRYFLGTQTSG